MRKKPFAYLYEDDFGAFTFHCKTKEEAQKAILEATVEAFNDDKLESYFEKEEDIVIHLNRIKDSWMYCAHKKCGANYWNIGENTCNECGETINAKGRHTFTYEF